MNSFVVPASILCASILCTAGSAQVRVCSNVDESFEPDCSSSLQTRMAVDAFKPSSELPIKFPSMDEVDKIKATFISSSDIMQLDARSSVASATGLTQNCFDGRNWLEKFAKEPSWNKYSQGDQDAVLSSLFSADHLGTTNKNFVEFGFPDNDFSSSYGNGRHLKENLGFNNSLLLDGGFSNPEINLHKRFATADNICGIFDEFKVPLEADYISVDIDSCDLWLFFAITEKYRPRLMTVEYNSNYPIDDYTTLRCANPKATGAYIWEGDDNIYGASLSAIELAAQKRGYSLIYVTPKLDTFFVRSDLLCPGTHVSKDKFSAATNLPFPYPEYNGKFGPKSEVVVDFKEWLATQS